MTMRMLKLPANADQKPDPELDLDDLETNFNAMLKIRGDISGKDFFFAFPGQAWAMVPQEGNYRCFRTFGLGAEELARLSWNGVKHAFVNGEERNWLEEKFRAGMAELGVEDLL